LPHRLGFLACCRDPDLDPIGEGEEGVDPADDLVLFGERGKCDCFELS
ncbi:MAG: hypothetical protein GX882_04885, partial [Methanomicrobiales archaeon]|nr:hypothetical protein [Methanomicrobiales archaeon]